MPTHQPPLAAAPDRYAGLWERLSLEDAHGRDETTRVLWLQTHSHYVDLRIPAARPDFGGITALAQCSDAQLHWLLGQQGFAGRLELSDGDCCHWRRELDLQPDATLVDAGRMVFGPERVTEYGLYADYIEQWRHTPPAHGELAALELAGAPRRGLLVVVGDWFMYALGRAEPLPQAPSLQALAAAASDPRAAMLRALDCEFSFGLRRGGTLPWTICHSTLPFREGQALFPSGDFSWDPVRREGRERRDGELRRWRTVACWPGFRGLD